MRDWLSAVTEKTAVIMLSTVNRASIEATSLARNVQADQGRTLWRAAFHRWRSDGESADPSGSAESLDSADPAGAADARPGDTAYVVASWSSASLNPTPSGKRSATLEPSSSGRSAGSGRSVSSRCPVSDGRLEDIPGSSHGVDHRLPASVDLLAQVGDVELDDVGLAAEVVVPHAVEDLRLGEHALRVAHEVAQQLELRCGQVDLLAAAPDLVAVLVESQVTDDEHGVGGRHGDRRATHERSDAGDDLLEGERLGDVVVAAGGQTRDAVLDGVLGGEEEDGHVAVVGTHAPEHLEPVEVGKHHVEHDRVGVELTGRAHGLHAGAGGSHLPPLVTQGHPEQLGEVHLVVDDEDPHRGAVDSLEPRGRGLGLLAHVIQ